MRLAKLKSAWFGLVCKFKGFTIKIGGSCIFKIMEEPIEEDFNNLMIEDNDLIIEDLD